MDQLNISVLDNRDELSNIRSTWTALWAQHNANNVFLSHDWICAYVDAFGLGERLFVIVVDDGNEATAILPLYWSADRILRVIGDTRSDYCDMICSQTGQEEVWQATLDFLLTRKDWLALDIRQTPECGRIFSADKSIALDDSLVSREKMAECPGIDLTVAPEDHNKMLNKKSMRRVVNKLARRGELKFEVFTDWADVEPRMGDFYEQHIARWNSIGEPSIYEDAEQRDFQQRYTRTLADSGCLHFSVLTCGESIAATHLGFLSGGRFIWYKPTYSLAFDDLSPGKVMLRFLLEDVISRDANYFDFTRGGEHYKLSLSNHIGQNHGIKIWPTAVAKLRYFAVHVPKRKLRSATGQFPALKLGSNSDARIS